MRKALMYFVKDNLGIETYQPNIVKPTTAKPYIVMRQTNQVESNINIAFDSNIAIWCYVENNYDNLDALVNNVINLIHDKEFTYENEVYKYKYLGFIGSEYYDKDFQALTQGLTFQRYNIYE